MLVKEDLVIFMYALIVGMFFGGGYVIGELILRALVKAAKDFAKGFKVPMAGEKLQRMIDEQDFGLTRQPLDEFLKRGDEFPERGVYRGDQK